MDLFDDPPIPSVRALTDIERTKYGLSEAVYAVDEAGQRWVRKSLVRTRCSRNAWGGACRERLAFRRQAVQSTCWDHAVRF